MRTLMNPESGEILSEAALSRRTLADLKGAFADEAARAALPQETEVYRVLTMKTASARGRRAACFSARASSTPARSAESIS